MKIVYILVLVVFLGSCSNRSLVFQTPEGFVVEEVTFGRLGDRSAIFTTAEKPLQIPHSKLKKVNVWRDRDRNENFVITTFIDPDQALKIKGVGQQVKLYRVMYADNIGHQDLFIARVE